MDLNLQGLTQLSEQMNTLYYILMISLCIVGLVLIMAAAAYWLGRFIHTVHVTSI